jgi:2-polyprenyl-6-methoxyphenol hydroxylase-like FAD-dependent oxidoreductase
VWAGDNPGDDYTFWGYADAADQFDLTGIGPRELVSAKIADWAPSLRALVAGSDPDSVNVVRMRSAAPVKELPAGPVTLLGDAIHNMTPMAGIGANTALRDADLLRRKLTGVQRGEESLTAALADYQRQMLDYGFRAVKLSHRNAKQAASGNRLARGMFRGVLRLTAAIPRLRRRMAASMGN